ncbi:MAG: flavodoxin [Bacteroidales bacterium]|nr:flavodoxin [Bacteroidales bacterium]
METVGIFYGSTSGSTRKAAEKIKELLGDKAELHNIKEATTEMIAGFSNLIFGTSAWGIGGMQDDWEDFIDSLADIDFSGKKIALFGLGDQADYPESFVDGLGTLYCRLPDKSVVVGYWPTKGYDYYFSLAERNDQFVGLALDDHHQKDMTDDRVKKWVAQLKKEFI